MERQQGRCFDAIENLGVLRLNLLPVFGVSFCWLMSASAVTCVRGYRVS